MSAFRAALVKLLSVEGDHMTACDRTMGATHPCTCGANEARRLLSEKAPSLPERLRAEAAECMALVGERHYHTSSGPLFEEAAREIEKTEAFHGLAAKVVEWDDARRRFLDHGFMGDAHEVDRLGVEIVTDAEALLPSPKAHP